MNNDSREFLIVKRLKEFCLSIDSIVINFPKKELLIRERLLNDSLEILYDVFYVNLDKNIDSRNNYKKRIISKFNMLDFYVEYLFKKNIINKKVCEKVCRELNEMCKMIYGWLRDEGRVK